MTTEADARRRQEIEQELLEFLQARTRKCWEAGADLFASGRITSLFAMELVVHIEQRYGISIGNPDLRLDNFRTVRAMAALIHRLRGPAA